jgi:FPC/CPF motif-containing protein YcgG
VNQQEHKTIKSEYWDFIITQKHPCVMAKSVFAMENYHLKVYDDITSTIIIRPILSDIENYLSQYNFESKNFESLVFCFENNKFESEIQFERALWNFLQRLHDADDAPWDSNVSKNPNNPDFSFSIKGKAFYIVGMHPKSSRIARRAPYCTMVFNLHGQFERLRMMGTYESVKNKIRERDKILQGSINPVLRDFNTDTEAKQYSGRNVEETWKCPFHHKDSSL